MHNIRGKIPLNLLFLPIFSHVFYSRKIVNVGFFSFEVDYSTHGCKNWVQRASIFDEPSDVLIDNYQIFFQLFKLDNELEALIMPANDLYHQGSNPSYSRYRG